MPRGVNYNQGFGLGRSQDFNQALIEDRAWDPSLLKLDFWLDPSLITNSRDLSGKNRTITSSSYPTVQRAQIHGYTAMSFNGTSNFLDIAFASTSCTICYVAVASANTNAAYYPIGTGGATGIGSGGTSVSQAATYAYNGTTVLSSTSTLIVGRPFISTASISSSGRTVWHNGEGSSTDANSQTVSAIRIGARADGFWWWNGAIGEVVITNGVLDTGDRWKLEAYMAFKWGFAQQLSRTNPFVSRGAPLIGD